MGMGMGMVMGMGMGMGGAGELGLGLGVDVFFFLPSDPSLTPNSVMNHLLPGASFACITFHALEEALVDLAFRRYQELGIGAPVRLPLPGVAGGEEAGEGGQKKSGRRRTRRRQQGRSLAGLKPSAQEVKRNPRSRSARLKAIAKAGLA